MFLSPEAEIPLLVVCRSVRICVLGVLPINYIWQAIFPGNICITGSSNNAMLVVGMMAYFALVSKGSKGCCALESKGKIIRIKYPDNYANSFAKNLIPASFCGTDIADSYYEDTGLSSIIRIKVVSFLMLNGFESYCKETYEAYTTSYQSGVGNVASQFLQPSLCQSGKYISHLRRYKTWLHFFYHA